VFFCGVHAAAKSGLQFIRGLRAANSVRPFVPPGSYRAARFFAARAIIFLRNKNFVPIAFLLAKF
jgi:hypothetical protein